MNVKFTVTFQKLEAWLVYAGTDVPINELFGKHVWRVSVAEGEEVARMEGSLDGSLEEITEAAKCLMEIRIKGKQSDQVGLPMDKSDDVRQGKNHAHTESPSEKKPQQLRIKE